MKFHAPIATTLSAVTAIATLGFLSFPAGALTLTNFSGTWSNVVLDNGIIVNPPSGSTVSFPTVGSENLVRWGDPASSAGQSGLGFTGVSSPLTFSIGETFEVGTLRHLNNPTFAPGATAVDLAVSLLFSDPVGLNGLFNFTFANNETNNAEPCPVGSAPCPDIISFPSAFASETFIISGQAYTLELLGFRTSSGGSVVTEFISPEAGTNSATLFARITTPPPPPATAPEPGTIAGLFLLGLHFVARRR